MTDTQNPTPVKHPVEDGQVPEHQLPDPLSTPELPPQTLTDEELDKALPVVKEEERNETAPMASPSTDSTPNQNPQ